MVQHEGINALTHISQCSFCQVAIQHVLAGVSPEKALRDRLKAQRTEKGV